MIALISVEIILIEKNRIMMTKLRGNCLESYQETQLQEFGRIKNAQTKNKQLIDSLTIDCRLLS